MLQACIAALSQVVLTRFGLNLNFEFESAHEFFMNLNFVISKSLNLNFVFFKSMNLNVFIKHSTKLDFFDLPGKSSDLQVVYISAYCKSSIKVIKLTESF